MIADYHTVFGTKSWSLKDIVNENTFLFAHGLWKYWKYRTYVERLAIKFGSRKNIWNVYSLNMIVSN